MKLKKRERNKLFSSYDIELIINGISEYVALKRENYVVQCV